MAGFVLLAAWCVALGSCGGASHHWRIVAASSPVRLAAVDVRLHADVTLIETRVPPTIAIGEFARNERVMFARTRTPVRLRVRRLGDVVRVDYASRTGIGRQVFVRRRGLMYVLIYERRLR